jgi:hypothetical protein
MNADFTVMDLGQCIGTSLFFCLFRIASLLSRHYLQFQKLLVETPQLTDSVYFLKLHLVESTRLSYLGIFLAQLGVFDSK